MFAPTAGRYPRPMFRLSAPLTLALALSMLLALVLGAFRPMATAPAQPAATLADLPLDPQMAISAAQGRADAAYHATAQAGGFQLTNARHGLRATFDAVGLTLTAGSSSGTMTLRGYGYGEAMQAPQPATPVADANRVSYARGDLTEWYLNGPLGLEQGFTLAQAPAGMRDGPLALALALNGWRAAIDSSGDSAELTSAAGATVRYRGLVAYDAAGRELPAWMESHGAELWLRVDDTGARYPLVVDPVDTTPPTITITTPPAGAVYTRGQVVNASYTCTDNTGVASCVGTVPNGSAIDTSSLGAKTFTVNAADGSGNHSTLMRSYSVVDATAPTIAITTPAAGAVYTLGQVVNADYACADEAGGSGLAACVGPVPNGSPIDTGSLGAKTFTVNATDTAGNASTLTRSYSVVDATAPTIAITTPADGTVYALGQVVNADYTCADEAGGSGLATCVGTVPSGSLIDTASIGAQTFTVNAADTAGNTSTLTHSYSVVDATAPTIAISTPADSAVYMLGQVVNADYACADEAGGSGLATCVGTVPSGSLIDTGSVGAKTFTVNAADTAGNTSTLSRSYTVAYSFSGFFQPVDNVPTLNQVKAGQSIPVKFSLGGNYGLGVLAAGYPVSQQVSCDGTAPIDVVEETTTANSGLTYDAATGQYTYVWKAQKSWAGTCRQFTLRLTDGTDHIALFTFK